MNAIFDDKTKDLHRARAARASDAPDFLWQHMAASVSDRLSDVKRSFDNAGLVSAFPFAPLVKIKHSENFSDAGTYDAVLSLGNLHWENDPVGALIRFNRALKPDGLFLGALFGGESLWELRDAIAEAEMEILNGISPRVSPFIALQDMAGLMQRAQFALPVADSEKITITYGDLMSLVRDLRGMGQSHAAIKRDRRILPKSFWPRVEEIYRARFSEKGKLCATVEIFHLLGWKQDASQPQALKPGSAKERLSDALKTIEIGAGDLAKN
jgi:SAM-dependent methyltransferase